MPIPRRLLGVSLLLLGGLGMAGPANAQTPPAASPTSAGYGNLRISTDTTDVQTPFVVAGSGFTPASTVVLTIADGNEPFASAVTNSVGAFNATVQLPPDVPFGMQTIVAAARTGSGVKNQVLVQYGGWPPLELGITASSGPSTGQVTFTVSGRNRSDYTLQTVRVRVPVPPGATFISATQGGAMVAGEVGWDSSGPLARGVLTDRSVTFQTNGPIATHAWAYFYHSGTGAGDDTPPGFESSAATPDVMAAP